MHGGVKPIKDGILQTLLINRVKCKLLQTTYALTNPNIISEITPGKVSEKPEKNIFITSNVKASPLVNSVNKHVLASMRQHLILKAYSTSTQKTYLNEVQSFLLSLGNHAADTFSVQKIKDYLQYCFEKLHLSENALHSRINALKFYYE